MRGSTGFDVTRDWLQDMADALALEADIMAEDGDYAAAAQLRDRAALYHEFVRVTRAEPITGHCWA